MSASDSDPRIGDFRTLLRSWEHLKLDGADGSYLVEVEEAMASVLKNMPDVDAMGALVEARSIEESIKSRRAIVQPGRVVSQVSPQSWLCELALPGTFGRVAFAESMLQASAEQFNQRAVFRGPGRLVQDRVGSTRAPSFGNDAGTGNRAICAELVIPDRRFCETLTAATKLEVLHKFEIRSRIVAAIEPSSGLDWVTAIEHVTVEIASRLANGARGAK